MKLCLTGKAGSGKSTVADYYSTSQCFTKLSFAQPVKEIFEHMMLRKPDKTRPKDRSALQRIGTEVGRFVDKDIWIKHFDLQYQKLLAATVGIEPLVESYIVVDDARFKNEVDYLRKNGFVIVRVIGRGYDMGELGKHPSESEMDSIVVDFTVDNSGDIEDTIAELESKYKSFIHTPKCCTLHDCVKCNVEEMTKVNY